MGSQSVRHESATKTATGTTYQELNREEDIHFKNYVSREKNTECEVGITLNGIVRSG